MQICLHPNNNTNFIKDTFLKLCSQENGENVARGWLLYSPSKGSVFCFGCKLFDDSDCYSTFTVGCSDWKNAAVCLVEREGSKSHKKLAYVTRCADAGCNDTELKKQVDSECEYWTLVLKRVVAVVKFLAFVDNLHPSIH